jgi:hypothetical protein
VVSSQAFARCAKALIAAQPLSSIAAGVAAHERFESGSPVLIDSDWVASVGRKKWPHPRDFLASCRLQGLSTPVQADRYLHAGETSTWK